MTQTHICIDNVTIEFPFKCPHCGRMITNREEVRAFQGYDKTRFYVEHISPGCVFRVREIEGYQDVADDEEAEE